MRTSDSLWTPLLLAEPSASLRLLALREFFDAQDGEAEVRELVQLRESDPLIAGLVAAQRPDGSWVQTHPSTQWEPVRETAQALTRLGYLGLPPDFPPVQAGVGFLISQQRSDGSWPLWTRAHRSKRAPSYDMIPLQTALPLRGLAACGYAQSPEAERAYQWLFEQRLDDGAWPTGVASGNFGGVAGYRRLSHSRWGCRTNTTETLRCLSLHPDYAQGPEAQRALDLLLASLTRDRDALGLELARLLGSVPSRGAFTYHAQVDSALILALCARIGASTQDLRVAALVTEVLSTRGKYGLWAHPRRPELSRWLTLDLLRSLTRLDPGSDWVSMEPPTPFQRYPRRRRRH